MLAQQAAPTAARGGGKAAKARAKGGHRGGRRPAQATVESWARRRRGARCRKAAFPLRAALRSASSARLAAIAAFFSSLVNFFSNTFSSPFCVHAPPPALPATEPEAATEASLEGEGGGPVVEPAPSEAQEGEAGDGEAAKTRPTHSPPPSARRHHCPPRVQSPSCSPHPQVQEVEQAPEEGEERQLHLSATAASGFKGVEERAKGQFEACIWQGGRKVAICRCSTAEAAAKAYAEAVARAAADEAAAKVAKAAAAAAAAAAPQVAVQPPPGAQGATPDPSLTPTPHLPLPFQNRGPPSPPLPVGLRIEHDSRDGTYRVMRRKENVFTYKTFASYEAAVAEARTFSAPSSRRMSDRRR